MRRREGMQNRLASAVDVMRLYVLGQWLRASIGEGEKITKMSIVPLRSHYVRNYS
jgi:hypothetical protein